MNKKATLSTIVAVIILCAFFVIALVIYFIGPEAVLNQLAKGADRVADYVMFGIMQTGEKSDIQSDKSTEETYENILSMLRAEGNGPCVFKYKPLPDNFEASILLSKVEENTLVQVKNNKGQFSKSNTVSGKVPCVIAGNSAENFYNNYLDGTPCTSNCPKDYLEADIELSIGEILVNGRGRDLEDNNLVFKTSDGNICFFPTKDFSGSWGCNAGDEGLDDDCMDHIEQNMKKCGEATYNPVFYDGTYYGRLDEWKLVSSFSSGANYYYMGADSRVPYMFRIEAKDDTNLGRKGLTKTGLDNVFSSVSDPTPSKQGIYFEKVYYDIGERWRYQEGGITSACNKCWIYTGDDEEVPAQFKTRGITMEEKMRIFGPPRSE